MSVFAVQKDICFMEKVCKDCYARLFDNSLTISIKVRQTLQATSLLKRTSGSTGKISLKFSEISVAY